MLAEFDRHDTMMTFHSPPLVEALRAGNWELCDFLVEHGADPNNALIDAASSNNRAALDRLRSYPRTDVDRCKHSMFVWTVLQGHFELAEELLAMGADIHHTPPGHTWKDYALLHAAVTGADDVVRWLMERGADAAVNREKILEVTKQRSLDHIHVLFEGGKPPWTPSLG